MGATRFGCLALAVAMAAGVTACQQLYGGKPDKLQTPKRVHHEPEVAGPDAPIKYIDDCAADFHADPRTVRPQIGAAQGLTSDGDNDLQKSEKESDANLKVNDIKDAISKYSNALRKDPYNAEATLNLARAYDLVLRKGCALAMLKRLSSLAANPKFAKEANLKLDSIDDNGAWFKGYRKDAMAAAGK